MNTDQWIAITDRLPALQFYKQLRLPDGTVIIGVRKPDGWYDDQGNKLPQTPTHWRNQ